MRTGRLVVIAAVAAAFVIVVAGLALSRPGRRQSRVVSDGAGGTRQLLWQELQPVQLDRCDLQRFGEPDDGGYLVCADLLDGVTAGYSYGISGYDGWGCDVAVKRGVTVHQYDCFDTRVPVCPGRTIFHAECIGVMPETIDGRRYDALDRQLAANGDAAARVVVKMDVEGAEWDAFLSAPAETLERIDQLIVEFHGTSEHRFLLAVQRLKQFFHVVNLHMNNYSCADGEAPFAGGVFEVLFVNKRLASAVGLRPQRYHALDRPNSPGTPDCQAPR